MQDHHAADGLRVSAPGKVLLTGGYLILEVAYAGLVLSTSARFHTTISRGGIKENHQETDATELHLEVESPQFGQIIRASCSMGASGRLALVIQSTSDRNAYIEETLLCALNGVLGLDRQRFLAVYDDLKAKSQMLRVLLQADNAFYSQASRLQQRGKSLTRRHLQELPEFLPPLKNVVDGKEAIAKTGLGSSAALITSLVAAIVHFFGVVDEASRLDVIHNLAQLSHCFVQRKVGSGFDVSAACYGSQRYTRFPSSLLASFTTPDQLDPITIASCVRDQLSWTRTRRVVPFTVPTYFHLLMGDVSSGSATVSMVKQVIQWQKSRPEETQRIISSLHTHNTAVEHLFERLHELNRADSGHFNQVCANLAEASSDKWIQINNEVGTVLVELRAAYAKVRCSFRRMGELAGVPIEPPEQTELLDATMAVPGVLFAGVPGAGGYDAIFLLALHQSTLDNVEKLWLHWSQTHPDTTICPLLCDLGSGGLQVQLIGQK